MSELSKLNLFQRLNEIRKKVEYIKKDRSVSTGGGSYKAVSHDAVTAFLRPHLIEFGVIVTTSVLDCDFDQKEPDAKQRLFHGVFAVTFTNADNPTECLLVRVPAHALDNGDKAPGKAISYATKYALLKTFTIETGEDEESRYKDDSDDFDYAGTLTKAEAGTREEARALLELARAAAVKFGNAEAAKAIGIVQKKLAAKFKASNEHADSVVGQA